MFQGRAGWTWSPGKQPSPTRFPAWRVSFEVDGRPVPARGRLWVAEASGAVVRTELRLEDRPARPGDVSSGGRAVITVDYGYDERLQLWVPSQMSERYDYPQRRDIAFVAGLARYGDYRRFEGGARLVLPR